MTESFPANLAAKQDQKYFGEKIKDPAMRHEVDGGYTVTRPRFTRKPRRTFTSGFTDLPDAEYQTFTAFYDAMQGGSDAFFWTHPTTGVTHTVRFVGDLDANYAGVGDTKLWNVQFAVEQV